jgi:hypothetical protein
MQQSPWEANSRSESRIPYLAWNPKGHYRLHNTAPLARIPNQMNPADILISYIFKIHFNIITSRLRSLTWSLLCRFSLLNYVWISHLAFKSYASTQKCFQQTLFQIRHLKNFEVNNGNVRWSGLYFRLWSLLSAFICLFMSDRSLCEDLVCFCLCMLT